MPNQQYIYSFTEAAPLDEIGEALSLAALAAESLHGRSSLRLGGKFRLDKEQRRCVVNATSQVGRDLAHIFTGFLGYQIGEKDFQVRLVDVLEETQTEGGSR